MADTTHVIGSTGIAKKLVDLGDGTYADAVAISSGAISSVASALDSPQGSEVVVAGANSALGQIGTVANAAIVYVRAPNAAAAKPYSKVIWRVQSDQSFDYQLFRSRKIANAPTITCASGVNNDTLFINGKTFTFETNTNKAAIRQVAADGASDTLEATDLVKVINAKAAITLASCLDNGTDYVTVNNGLANYVYTAKAATAVASRQFIHENDATAAAALATCINHKDTITCATVVAGSTVTVNGKVYTAGEADAAATGVFDHETDTHAGDGLVLCINHKANITLNAANVGDKLTIAVTGPDGTSQSYVYTAAAAAQTCNRIFSQGGSDTADALSLVAGINDSLYGIPHVTASSALGVVSLTPAYGYTATATAGVGGIGGATRIVCVAGNGVPGITASNVAGVVSLTRDNAATTVTTSTSTPLTITFATAKGVPGVTAEVLDGAEVALTPTWATSVTATASTTTETEIVCANDLGVPGVTAAQVAAVITLTATTATTTHCVDGTGAHHACAQTILTALDTDGAASTGNAANNTTNGKLVEQYIDGYPYPYISLKNVSGAAAATFVVGATLVP